MISLLNRSATIGLHLGKLLTSNTTASTLTRLMLTDFLKNKNKKLRKMLTLTRLGFPIKRSFI